MKAITFLIGLALALTLASTSGKAETGLGLQFGDPLNVALSARFDDIAIGAGWRFGDGGYLVADIDYWLLKNDLAKDLDWYLGPGVGVLIGDPFRLNIRGVLGLQWMPAKQWEIFGQVAPYLQLINELQLRVGGAVGVRYIF
jgi:hypothetical protein